MNLLLVEDEQFAAYRLKSFIRRYNLSWDIINELTSISELLYVLKNTPKQIDLILSDIELSDGNLMQVIHLLPKNIPIIFVTAYDQYWQKAFSLNSIHYITKPFDFKQIKTALDKFVLLNKQGNLLDHEQISLLLNNSKHYKEKLLIKKHRKLHLIDVKSIGHFLSEGGILFARIGDQRMLLKETSLTNLKSTLNPNQFFRINRHQIVNSNHISSIQKYNKDTLLIKLSDGNELRTSQGRTKPFKDWLDKKL
ncbi:LytTR family DNA-binding domain-containing protein [Aquimarina gracilis]|uniref:LytTR family DNA-binding domain-containing protein n=1 Tax=Aquimarina gracilis TaxID=874422 RepID=A0ABU5ZRK1_9FLAO|nr:LytTR family DNA-binding domain-containing protein [Aquimarina gracilis]MEB3344685.1 LytTR family DNA-binding domain-containing protein [Aquimarina gracilis]